jgi:hypothetical protein
LLTLIVVSLLSTGIAFGSEIREFDLKTTEHLGQELSRASQRADRGATNAAKKRAMETAKTAFKSGQSGAGYDYVVLDDPDGSGFLVYALAATDKRDATYIGGHFRIMVSADGGKLERVDDLSKGIIRNQITAGGEMRVIGTAQAVKARYPVETFIYSSYRYKIPIFVGTRDGSIWQVNEGRIQNTGEKSGAARSRTQKKK